MRLIALFDHNNSAWVNYQSNGTPVCPAHNGCCYNPGEDADGNTTVRLEEVEKRW